MVLLRFDGVSSLVSREGCLIFSAFYRQFNTCGPDDQNHTASCFPLIGTRVSEWSSHRDYYRLFGVQICLPLSEEVFGPFSRSAVPILEASTALTSAHSPSCRVTSFTCQIGRSFEMLIVSETTSTCVSGCYSQSIVDLITLSDDNLHVWVWSAAS